MIMGVVFPCLLLGCGGFVLFSVLFRFLVCVLCFVFLFWGGLPAICIQFTEVEGP